MANLDNKILRDQVLKDKRRMQAIKRKMKLQQEKEISGEEWKKIEQQKLQQEMEDIIGDNYTIELLDSIDINCYFDTINIFKDEKGNIKKIDLDKYNKAEIEYDDAVIEINKDIVYEDDIKKSLASGGSDIKPYRGQNNTKAKEIYKTINQEVSGYIHRFVPLYNKYICCCCGRPLSLSNFPKSSNKLNCSRIDINGVYHMPWCWDCIIKIFNYYYYKETESNPELATKMLCNDLNLYWDIEVYNQAKIQMEGDNRRHHFVVYYIGLINTSYVGETFLNSPFIINPSINDNIQNLKSQIEDDQSGKTLSKEKEEQLNIPFGWNKEDVQNQKVIKKMIGYDPFEYEDDENKKVLYKDLMGMLEPGMENDMVKLQAAIQIVQSFFRVREMNKKYRELEQNNASVTELKQLSDLKSKELKAITDFSKDNGFSERFATAKARGENTFTGIMKKMNEAKYEDALVNKYDIETSSTIQQAADASFKAIFNQLGMGESEVWKVAQEQLAELNKKIAENEELKEQLRLTKYELSKIKLEEKAKALEENQEEING